MTIFINELDILVEAIYDTSTAAERWPETLQRVANAFDSAGAALLLWRSEASVVVASPGLSAAARDYEAEGRQFDLLIDRAVGSGAVGSGAVGLSTPHVCYTDLHLALTSDFVQHPYYSDFCSRHQLGPFLGSVVAPHPDQPVLVIMPGRSGRRPYAQSEIAAFATITRHVERALMVGQRLQRAESEQQALAEGLARLGTGIYLLNASGRVSFVNTRGDTLLGTVLSLDDGHLRVRGAGRTQFASAVQRALQGGANNTSEACQKPIVLSATDSHEAVVLYVLPIITRRTVGAGRDDLTEPRAMVLALDRDVGTAADPTIIRHLLGLTLGEARLAAQIGAGKTPREAAQILKLSENSARTILKRVYAKVGVSRQAELATMLSRLTLRF
jgi:DNA-binding CsgD family transcriptional regulator